MTPRPLLLTRKSPVTSFTSSLHLPTLRATPLSKHPLSTVSPTPIGNVKLSAGIKSHRRHWYLYGAYLRPSLPLNVTPSHALTPPTNPFFEPTILVTTHMADRPSHTSKNPAHVFSTPTTVPTSKTSYRNPCSKLDKTSYPHRGPRLLPHTAPLITPGPLWQSL